MGRLTDSERFLLGVILTALIGWSLTVVALQLRIRELEGHIEALSVANRSLAEQAMEAMK